MYFSQSELSCTKEPNITGHMKVSCGKTSEVITVLFCLQVCVSWLWGELGSERDWSVPLHPPAKHPGRSHCQQRQPVFLHRPKDLQELHLGWSTGHQHLSKRSVCICFVEHIMLRHPGTFVYCFIILLSSLAFWIVFVSLPSEQEDLSTSLCPTSFMAVRPCERTCWASIPARSTMSPTWMWNL